MRVSWALSRFCVRRAGRERGLTGNNQQVRFRATEGQHQWEKNKRCITQTGRDKKWLMGEKYITHGRLKERQGVEYQVQHTWANQRGRRKWNQDRKYKVTTTHEQGTFKIKQEHTARKHNESLKWGDPQNSNKRIIIKLNINNNTVQYTRYTLHKTLCFSVCTSSSCRTFKFLLFVALRFRSEFPADFQLSNIWFPLLK